MNEKLKAMLAGLTAVHFCGEMAGHQIMDAPAPVEPTQLDRIERKLDELLLLARVEFDGEEWDNESLDDEGISRLDVGQE